MLALLLAVLPGCRICGGNVEPTGLHVLIWEHDAVQVHLARLFLYLLAGLLPTFAVLFHAGALLGDGILYDLQLLAVGLGPMQDCLRIK